MADPDRTFLVLLLGEVGSGKSTFAHLVTQDRAIDISPSLVSGASLLFSRPSHHGRPGMCRVNANTKQGLPL